MTDTDQALIQAKVQKRIAKIRTLVQQRGGLNDALDCAASLHQAAKAHSERKSAIRRIAKKAGVEYRRSTGLAGAILKLAVPNLKRSAQSRYVKVLKFASKRELRNGGLAKWLKKQGGVDAIVRTGSGAERENRIKAAKKKLKSNELCQFVYSNDPPDSGKWITLLGRWDSSGSITVHHVIRDTSITGSLLAKIGRGLKGEID